MSGRLLVVGLCASIVMLACSGERALDVRAIKQEPKTFVGSETCKTCHLEHYDSWKMTLHSRMLISTKENPHAFVAELNPEIIRADLEKIKDKLKIPPEEVYIPTTEEVHYVIGTQWKQRYLVQKDGVYYVAPVQFNLATRRWVNYYENAWDQRDWLVRCGGCHATGVDWKKADLFRAVHRLRGLPRAGFPAHRRAADGSFREARDHHPSGQIDGGRFGPDLRFVPHPGQFQASGLQRCGLAGGLHTRHGPGADLPDILRKGRHAPPLPRLFLTFTPSAIHRLAPVSAP
jgi:hypothetical protein